MQNRISNTKFEILSFNTENGRNINKKKFNCVLDYLDYFIRILLYHTIVISFIFLITFKYKVESHFRFFKQFSISTGGD